MHTGAADALLSHMHDRCHVAPKRLTAPGPNPDELACILTAAAQAPDHGRIRPFRFILIPTSQREALGQALKQALLARDPCASFAEQTQAYDKAFHAPCLLLAVINLARTEPEVPVYERMISLGCAIQNMLLMAQALSFGSGITSGQAMNAPSIRALCQLQTDEQGVCYLALGRIAMHKPRRPRPQVHDLLSSL